MGISMNEHISLNEINQLSEISSINEFNSYVSLQRLRYLSQLSNAVLVGGLDHEIRDSFDYEKNTATMVYQFGNPSERELRHWRERQHEYPSFQLSSAVLNSSQTY